MDVKFSYTFKLSNSITRINLPYPIKNVSKLKVRFVSYITNSANQKLMTFKISQFNSNIYYDGTSIIKYSKIIALPPSISTPIVYENLMPEADVVIDDSLPLTQNGISSLTIEVMIDNNYSNDINGSNPLFVVLLIY